MKIAILVFPLLIATPALSVAEEDIPPAVTPYPFPAIELVPERGLFQANQHGNPSIAPEHKPRVAELSASPDTPKNLRWHLTLGL